MDATSFTTASPALDRAARETPEAILSKLRIINKSDNRSNRPITGRAISACSEPGDTLRYYISFPDEACIKVFKSNPAGGHSTVADIAIKVGAIRCIFQDGSRIDTSFGDIQKTQQLQLPLTINGKQKTFAWKIVSRSNADEINSTPGQAKDRPAMGVEPRRKRDSRMVGLKLVDVDAGYHWAIYYHQTGQHTPVTHKSCEWGTVEIKCRTLMLDDGIDKAFVTMIALVESYVRIFAPSKTGALPWRGFTTCSVM